MIDDVNHPTATEILAHRARMDEAYKQISRYRRMVFNVVVEYLENNGYKVVKDD